MLRLGRAHSVFLTFHESFGWKRHVHRKKAGQYGCDQCEKSFTNENALKYHVDNHMK